jgi:hypothetical protein
MTDSLDHDEPLHQHLVEHLRAAEAQLYLVALCDIYGENERA